MIISGITLFAKQDFFWSSIRWIPTKQRGKWNDVAGLEHCSYVPPRLLGGNPKKVWSAPARPSFREELPGHGTIFNVQCVYNIYIYTHSIYICVGCTIYIYIYIMYIHILFNETLQLPHHFLHKKQAWLTMICVVPTLPHAGIVALKMVVPRKWRIQWTCNSKSYIGYIVI